MRTLSSWGIFDWSVLALIEAGCILYYLKFKKPKKIEDPIIITLIGILLLFSLGMISFLYF